MGRLTTGPLGAYSYGASAHLRAATAISSTWTAAYDAAGDMTCRAATSATTCAGGSPNGSPMTWDTEGRLIEWTSPTGAPWSSSIDLYDGEGNRVQQQTVAGGVTTQTYYIGNLEEVSVSGGTTTTTTYYYAGNGGPRIATATNGVFSYLASDTLGTAEVALDANGNTTAAQLYAPYGTTRYSSGTVPGSYGYTGQRADAVTGLDYYNARYYEPLAGQFASADTILPGKGYDVWGLSRYAYVEGNPITRHGTEEGRSKWTRGHALCSLIGTAERQHSAKRLAVKPLIMPRWPAPRPAGQLPPLCGARSGGYTGEAKEAGGQQIGGIMEEPWRRYHERRGWAGQGQGGRYSPCARAAEARPSACTRGRGLAVLALLGLALVAPLSGCASPLGSLFPAPTPTPPCDPFALCKVVLPRCGAPVTSAQFTYGPWYTGLALPRNVPALVGFPPQLPASLPNGLSLYRVAVFGSPAAAAGHLLLHVGYGPFPPREDPSLRGPSRKSVLGLDEAGGPLGPLDFLPTPNEPLEVADQVAATVNGQPAVLYHVVSPRAPASAYEVIELIWKSGPITMRLIATTGGIGVYTTPEPPVTVDSIATWVGVVGDPNTGAKDTALLAFAPRVAPFTGCQ